MTDRSKEALAEIQRRLFTEGPFRDRARQLVIANLEGWRDKMQAELLRGILPTPEERHQQWRIVKDALEKAYESMADGERMGLLSTEECQEYIRSLWGIMRSGLGDDLPLPEPSGEPPPLPSVPPERRAVPRFEDVEHSENSLRPQQHRLRLKPDEAPTAPQPRETTVPRSFAGLGTTIPSADRRSARPSGLRRPTRKLGLSSLFVGPAPDGKPEES